MYEQEMNQLSEKMDKSITALKNEFTTIRTARLMPASSTGFSWNIMAAAHRLHRLHL